MKKETIKTGLTLLADAAVTTVIGSAVGMVTPWASVGVVTKLLSCTGAFLLGSMAARKMEEHVSDEVDNIEKIIKDAKKLL